MIAGHLGFLSVDAGVKSIISGPLADWTFYGFAIMPLLLVAVISAWYARPRPDNLTVTPAFELYQRRYLIVWGLAVGADWLQGPYVYALYSSYGYNTTEINRLFVAGFGASMLFGTFAGSLADAWGRKRACVLYCVLCIASCITKHSNDMNVLYCGRILGGIATSLLFSTFECWLVSELRERHQYGSAMLRYMLGSMHFVSFLVAIFSGFVAQACVDALPMRRVPGFETVHYGGRICPFDMAIVWLLICIPLICITWEENYGNAQAKQRMSESLRTIMKSLESSWRVGLVGLVVACFEGSMYAFVINWTPALALPGATQPPHGLVFSSLMMACMIGSCVFSSLSAHANPAKVVLLACVMSAVAFAAVSCVAGNMNFVSVEYYCFLLFEFCAGLYMPSIGALKSELVPEEARAGVYNVFRIPLNIIVLSVILANYSSSLTFAWCCLLLLLAALFVSPLSGGPMHGHSKLQKGVLDKLILAKRLGP